MLRVLKWIGIGIVTLLLVFVGTVYAMSERAFSHTYQTPDEAPLAISPDSTSIARGRHLFTATTLCVECHAADAGGALLDSGGPFKALVAPNLTRGKGSAVAHFTPADWERAIRHGVRADGTSLIVMPSEAFAHLSDEDVAAIIAYLGQVPPVDRELPPTGFSFLGRALVGFGVMPALVAGATPRVSHVRAVETDTTAAYGRYLADISGCSTCHGPDLSGGANAGPPGAPPASNLTPTGIGHWSREDFARAVREGRRPSGAPIDEFMPWKVFAGMTDAEIAALWNYLKAVPPKEYGGT